MVAVAPEPPAGPSAPDGAEAELGASEGFGEEQPTRVSAAAKAISDKVFTIPLISKSA
jgi:hypothetical protein